MPSVCNEIIDDIEDLISAQDITPKERYSTRRAVTIRSKKRHEETTSLDLSGTSADAEESGVALEIPGNANIFVKTWGCSHNSSDSEYMAGQLAAYGYKLTDVKENAHLWLLNSCTVKNPSEDHFRNEISDAKRLGKRIVLAGCVPQGAPKSEYIQGLSVIGVQQIDRVVEVVEETLKGHSVRFLNQKKSGGHKLGGASLELPKVRKNDLIEIIAINTGCLNQCTYCKTKHARGDLGSYLPDQIVSRAAQSLSEGVKEIWLTSEDTGTYGRDIGTNLPELLWKLVDVLPDGCMLRLGMTNPPYILEHLEDMAKILAHPRVYSFLHVPVQSGSDAVLTDMKREYCRSDFENVVDFLRERVPGVTIATDIICGFPSETDEDFEETLSLCAKYKFPSLFINQFFPRPGTPAAKMPRVASTQEVKKRTKRLSELFQSYEPYGHKLGEVQDVLVTEVSHDKKHFVGHNKFYEQFTAGVPDTNRDGTQRPRFLGRETTPVDTFSPIFSLLPSAQQKWQQPEEGGVLILTSSVLVPQVPGMLGRVMKVKITATQKHCMIGTPLNLPVEEECCLVVNDTVRLRTNAIVHSRKEQYLITKPSSAVTLKTHRFRLMVLSFLLFSIAVVVRIAWNFVYQSKAVNT